MINFGLVGCGRIAERYAALLTGKVSGAKLVAVCDSDLKKAKALADRIDVVAYADMHKMMESESIDVVCVLTPSGFHAEHVTELAKFKKHILVEKPMALTVADATRMNQACARAGIKLFVVKQNRYNLPIMRLREVFDKGCFGKLILGTIRVRWCRMPEYYAADEWRGTADIDGGVLANQASHHLDLLEWFFGNPKKVFARGKSFLSGTIAEDTAVATVEFESGALGIIEATTATRPKDIEGSFSILGEHGMVEVGGFAVNRVLHWQFDAVMKSMAGNIEGFAENPPDVYGFGHKRYLDRVVEAIVNDSHPDVDGGDGLRTVAFIEALRKSLTDEIEINL